MALYRGVMHAHSTYSYDGHLTLLELKRLFQERGFHFILMTEHTDYLDSPRADEFIRDCVRLSDDNFLMIPGFEVPYRDAHVMCVGVEQFYHENDAFSLIDRFFQSGSLVVLAHPHRNHFILDDRMMQILHGVEVWNSQYDGKRAPRFSSLSYFNIVHTRRSDVFAYAGFDFHRESHGGGPFLSIESQKLSRVSIVRCLREGKYIFGTSHICVSHCGIISGVPLWWLRCVSFWSICCISFGKGINSFLKKRGLSLPPRFTRSIRRFI